MLTENRKRFENTSTESRLRGGTASDNVTPVRHGCALELSTLIEVTLLSLSQIQHRRRLNNNINEPAGASECDADAGRQIPRVQHADSARLSNALTVQTVERVNIGPIL